MKGTREIDFSKINETSKAEQVIKSWVLTKQEQSDKNSIITKNKVTLTDKRLITSCTVNNESYQRNSYMLSDIHAVNCFVGQSRIPNRLFLGLGVTFLLLGLASLAVAIAIPAISIGLYVAAAILSAIALVFFFIKNQEVGVTVSLELENTKHIEIAESDTSNKVNLSKEKQIKLSFEPCNEAVEMALELDVLVMNAKEMLATSEKEYELKINKNNRI